MQERANEFEGATDGERRLCQALGEEKLNEAEGGGLTKRGWPRAIAKAKGTSVWAGKRTMSGWAGQGRARTFPNGKQGLSG